MTKAFVIVLSVRVLAADEFEARETIQDTIVHGPEEIRMMEIASIEEDK